MLVTSTPDGPTTNTQSKTCNPTHTMLPMDESTTDKVNAPQPLIEDLLAKHPFMKLTHLHTLEVSFTSMLWNEIKNS